MDITPELIKKVNTFYANEMIKSPAIKAVTKKVEAGTATYSDAYRYARAVGNARAKAFTNVISSNVLPDGRMYFGIADPLIHETLPADYEAIQKVANAAQVRYNKSNKIGLKTKIVEVDDDKLMGFINRISSEEVYDDIAWILNNPVRNFCQSVVDENIKANSKFLDRAGVKVGISRVSSSGCCLWCSELAGDYTYPAVPDEVFMRHDNCNCTVIYNNEELGGTGHSFNG